MQGDMFQKTGFDFSNVKSILGSTYDNITPIFAVDEEGGTVQRALSGYPDARSYEEDAKNDDYTKLQEDSASKAKALLEMLGLPFAK